MEEFDTRNFKNPFPEFNSAVYNDEKETHATLRILLHDIARFTDKVKPGEKRALASVPRKNDEDFSLFDGAGGYLHLYLNLSNFCSKLAENHSLAEAAKKIIEVDRLPVSLDPYKYLGDAKLTFSALESIESHSHNPRITYLCGSAGLYLLGAHLHFALGDSTGFHNCVKKVLATKQLVINASSRELYHELLYGTSGFLYCLLELQRKYELSSVPAPFQLSLEDEVLDLCELIVKAGLNANPSQIDLTRSLPDDFRLVYHFHGKEYFGAAHGLCGILYLLMRAFQLNKESIETKRSLFAKTLLTCVQGSLITILKYQLPSGNFPSSFSRKERDCLVQFCHGSPGAVPCLLLASEFFASDKLGIDCLEAARKGGDNIWHEGLLKKGFGLCHGISGNAYPFLDLYRCTKEKKWLYRAHRFAQVKDDAKLMKAIHSYAFPSRYTVGESDHPYGLMNGLAGDLAYFKDLVINPEGALFPGYQV